MNFILKMAWRDSRASRRRLLLASSSIVLGIAALVAIASFNDNLITSIDGQAKTLLGADLMVQTRAEFSEPLAADLAELGGQQANEIVLSTMVVFPTAENATRLATMRAIEGQYPFYGEFVTVPADAPARLNQGGRVAIMEETMMAQYGVTVGDEVKLGTQFFEVVGALQQVPGDSMAVAMLSPRVFVPLETLDETGLLGPGSIVRHRRYIVFDDDSNPQQIERRLRRDHQEERLAIDTVEERKSELGNSLRNVYRFLSLVGFVALFLGAIGVASAVHVHIRQKIPTVAVLRCLGASSRTAFGVYLVQGLALGVVGALVGAALGVAVQVALPALVAGSLPVDVTFDIVWRVVAKGALAGLVICGLFTLLPLLAVRRVPPLAAIRADVAPTSNRSDPWIWAVYAAIVLVVVLFSFQQAPRWQIGAGFVGMLTGSFLVLAALGKGVAWAARRFTPKSAPYVWRQGIANLHRPNNRTLLLLLALGLGTFLMVTLVLTRSTLLAQIEGTGGGDRPNLLFFDVQDDQIGPLREVMKREGAPLIADAPIVTMRIASVKGVKVADLLKDRSRDIPSWTLRREYRSTFRDAIVDRTEKITEGEFVSRVGPDVEVVPVSIEVGLAEDIGLEIGDEIEWDVQGLPMKTRVASLREVEWRRLEPNFFVVWPAGVLEPAPKFWVAAARAGSPEDSARIQREVIAELPNVSAIDLQLVMETLDGIFEKVQFVIQFMALFTVATGVIVLAGAIMSGRHQRLKEAVLLRTLGANSRQLWQIQLIEYAVLGGLAALTGCGLALLGNWGLAFFVFDTTAAFPPTVIGGALGGVIAVTVLTGLLASRGVANHPPLEVLRAEG
ncbi:MAG: ABC transporter permease [Synoicihabitans sp.]